jgi:hypothetical protein
MPSVAPTVEITMIDQKVNLSPSKPQRYVESAARPQLQFLTRIDAAAFLLMAIFLLGRSAYANPLLGGGKGCRFHCPGSQLRTIRLMVPHDGTADTFQLSHAEVISSGISNSDNLAFLTATTPSWRMSNRLQSPIELTVVPLTGTYSNGRGGYVLLGQRN